MFKKLVTNLPFNSSLINQVGFYADRLRQEKSIRRLSFVFMALALSVQSLAILAPPERSLAYSSNHITNGVRTRDDILRAYDNNTDGVREIYERFYISRADIASLSKTPNDTIRSNDGNDYSTIGRNSLWNYGKVAPEFKKTERKFYYQNLTDAPVGESIYIRNLRAWDIQNPYNTYSAFKGKNTATGQTFWILVDCGNITWVPPYDQPPVPETPPPPTPEPITPALDIRKTIVEDTSTLKPGDTYTYRIEYRNNVRGSTAEDVIISDQLDLENYSVVSVDSPHETSRTALGYFTADVGDLRYSESYSEITIKVRLSNPMESGTKICNGSSIVATNAPKVSTKKDVCVIAITPIPYVPTVPDITVNPDVSCKLLITGIERATRKITYKTIVRTSNASTTQIIKYRYDFGDGKTQEAVSTSLTHSTIHTYQADEKVISYDSDVVVSYRTTGQEQATDKTVECSGSVDFDDKALGEKKTVSNLTRNLVGEAALDSAVRAGETLRYTLTTTNSQDYPRNDVTIVDDIGDVLDYATLNLAALEAEGGSFDAGQNKITWSDLTVPANSQIELNFEVTLLNPIPATNRPSTVSGDFDCVIDNTYGNTVNMSVQCPAVKGLESLPNTGPGTSLIAVMGITLTTGYFFARARLMSKEIQIIRTDYVATGGM
jgi:fimbrial isopeptide formation D2 family protein